MIKKEIQGGSSSTLNEIIRRNDLQKESGPKSVGTEDYGTVKVFFWNTDSERHDAITDELNNNDFDYYGLYVSGDIPHGDVSALHIENTG